MTRIHRRYRGPVDSGNGGYSAGVLATHVPGDAEVTLRRPPPLDEDLQVERDGERVLLVGLDGVVAEAVPTTVDVEIPPSPGLDAARGASEAFAGHERHFFPECFSCGPDRDDGLAIFPGPLGDERVAAPFTPRTGLPAVDGALAIPIVWAALDCAGAWAEHRAMADSPIVLGRMAAHVDRPVPVEGTHVVVGWPTDREGRKLFSATAIYDETGIPLAWSRQTWIVLRD